MRPTVHGFYEERSGSIQYVVACPSTKACAIVDPVLDFDEKSGAIATRCADEILAFVAGEGLSVDWVLDTHPHADHLSAAAYLKAKTGARTGTGARIVDVQALWREIYGFADFRCDGSQWDKLFAAGETFRIGAVDVRTLFTPGHTLASVCFIAGNAALVADTLFMPDTGTARADFPGGSAAMLFDSIQRIFALPDETRVFIGHDYGHQGRNVLWESTVGVQKATNVHFADRPSRAAFVARREARDATLPMPRLILHALQINIRAGHLPEPDAAGRRFLTFPLDALALARWT